MNSQDILRVLKITYKGLFVTKVVQEDGVKIYVSYVDALLDSNGEKISISYEGGLRPRVIDHGVESYRLRSFTRGSGKEKILEEVYIKIPSNSRG